jgi:hypothetical protein
VRDDSEDARACELTKRLPLAWLIRMTASSRMLQRSKVTGLLAHRSLLSIQAVCIPSHRMLRVLTHPGGLPVDAVRRGPCRAPLNARGPCHLEFNQTPPYVTTFSNSNMCPQSSSFMPAVLAALALPESLSPCTDRNSGSLSVSICEHQVRGRQHMRA